MLEFSNLIIMNLIILFIAISMSMVGKGGGNFYVIAMVLYGLSMHEAAITSQLIMVATSLTAMFIFHKHNKVDWKLALIIEVPTAIMAFVGGFFAGYMQGNTLKLIFAIVLLIVSFFMVMPVKGKAIPTKKRFGHLHRKFNDSEYVLNLWLVLPLTSLIGFFAGAVGISGGAFKIPLMVMLCGIPMEIAVGTSSAMVALTAFMGFSGHMVNGSFNPQIAIPLVVVAVLGGFLGSRFAIKSKPKNLKAIFAITNLIAGFIMLINIIIS